MSMLQARSPATSGPVQLLADGPPAARSGTLSDPLSDPLQLAGDGEGVRELAGEGFQGGGGSLPFLDRIQQSFGRHDVSHVQAYSGSAASDAAGAMGARAYASGSRVAFGGAPDLHTAAHEAAHVVQQAGGVQLKDGVGSSGDRYERHADAVADAVVQGRSAEGLLDPFAGGGDGVSASAGVQQVQLAEEVFDPAAFANPTNHLKGAQDQHKVVEEPGSQGILGDPDMKVINALGDPATRDAKLDEFDEKFNKLTKAITSTEAAISAAEQAQDAEGAQRGRVKLQGLKTTQALLAEIMSDVREVTDLPSAGKWYRKHTLAISKMGASPTIVRNVGDAAANGHKTYTFHKDAGMVTVAAASLTGNPQQQTAKADALNGPWRRGFVRGHGSIGNMKHRFIEHIHVNKGQGDAIDIYNASQAQGQQALDHAAAVTPVDQGLAHADVTARDAANQAASDADITTLTQRQAAIDAAAQAQGADAPAADED